MPLRSYQDFITDLRSKFGDKVKDLSDDQLAREAWTRLEGKTVDMPDPMRAGQTRSVSGHDFIRQTYDLPKDTFIDAFARGFVPFADRAPSLARPIDPQNTSVSGEIAGNALGFFTPAIVAKALKVPTQIGKVIDIGGRGIMEGAHALDEYMNDVPSNKRSVLGAGASTGAGMLSGMLGAYVPEGGFLKRAVVPTAVQLGGQAVQDISHGWDKEGFSGAANAALNAINPFNPRNEIALGLGLGLSRINQPHDFSLVHEPDPKAGPGAMSSLWDRAWNGKKPPSVSREAVTKAVVNDPIIEEAVKAAHPVTEVKATTAAVNPEFTPTTSNPLLDKLNALDFSGEVQPRQALRSAEQRTLDMQRAARMLHEAATGQARNFNPREAFVIDPATGTPYEVVSRGMGGIHAVDPSTGASITPRGNWQMAINVGTAEQPRFVMMPEGVNYKGMQADTINGNDVRVIGADNTHIHAVDNSGQVLKIPKASLAGSPDVLPQRAAAIRAREVAQQTKGAGDAAAKLEGGARPAIAQPVGAQPDPKTVMQAILDLLGPDKAKMLLHNTDLDF